MNFVKRAYWLDAGLVGLIKTIDKIDVSDISIYVDDSALKITGLPDKVQIALEAAYDRLVEDYYNVSSKRQIEDTTSYNFYYDEQNDKFVAFPKRKAMGMQK